MSLRDDRDAGRWRDYIRACLADLGNDTDDTGVPVNPCRVPRECTVPVTPRHYGRAVAAGCEDAYLNAMRAKYGEGWD